jgi:hypothetical protein
VEKPTSLLVVSRMPKLWDFFQAIRGIRDV